MTKKKMPEIHCRASRICRVLGNPTAYEIMHILRRSAKTPSELAKLLGLSLATISQVLRSLRQLDLVRYDVRYRERIYWIKEDTVLAVMKMLENMVRKIRSNGSLFSADKDD